MAAVFGDELSPSQWSHTVAAGRGDAARRALDAIAQVEGRLPHSFLSVDCGSAEVGTLNSILIQKRTSSGSEADLIAHMQESSYASGLAVALEAGHSLSSDLAESF